MKLFRPLFFAFCSIGMLCASALAMPIADLRHLSAPTPTIEATYSSIEAADQVTASVVSEVMQIFAFALMLAIVVLAIAAGVLRRRRRIAEFDGGFFDAWRLPDWPPG